MKRVIRFLKSLLPVNPRTWMLVNLRLHHPTWSNERIDDYYGFRDVPERSKLQALRRQHPYLTDLELMTRFQLGITALEPADIARIIETTINHPQTAA